LAPERTKHRYVELFGSERVTNIVQKIMEILVLDNLKSAVEKGVLITQVPEQLPKVRL
jgi:hypothetical protein